MFNQNIISSARGSKTVIFFRNIQEYELNILLNILLQYIVYFVQLHLKYHFFIIMDTKNMYIQIFCVFRQLQFYLKIQVSTAST